MNLQKKWIRLGSNLQTVTKKTDVLKQLKDENVTIFSENLQNVALASAFCYTIPIDLVVILPVWK